MSTLRAGDILQVRLLRKVEGKFLQERVDLDADAVRFMSTPELLRTFSAAIATASERLDITEEHATGADDGSAPWCEPCQSYHSRPRDKQHHESLGCYAPWEEREPEASAR